MTMKLNESLKPGILENVVLPVFSVDEYVPEEPGANNIVLSFIVIDDPVATLRLAEFLRNLEGVYKTTFSDSSIYRNAMVVYVEFTPLSDLTNLINAIHHVSRLIGKDVRDMNMFVPEIMDKHEPYDINKLLPYLMKRMNYLKRKEAENIVLESFLKAVK